MFQDSFDPSILQWNYQGLKEVMLHLLREEDLKQIKYLFLKRNLLNTLPEDLGKLASLTQLHVQGNNLTCLPNSIGDLKCLEILDVEGNNLTELPPSIGKLSQLKKLQISNNSLRKLPTEIGKLTNLKTLEANNNSLHSVPSELGQCPLMTIISLDKNRLTWLPRQLCNLKFLDELSVCGNFLEFIPQKIGSKSLLRLNVDNNPGLFCLPFSVRNGKNGYHSCGLLATEKRTRGHAINVTKHCDAEPTRVILPCEIEEVLVPDRNCVPSLQEMALRSIGSVLKKFPELIETCDIPYHLKDLLLNSTDYCLFCRNSLIYISAFPVVYEGLVKPQRVVGLYLAFCCSLNCFNHLPKNPEYPMLFPYREDTLNPIFLFR